tara:strand:- start:906 stop:1220 length:315 start_codon:yes stop_codon:yes gene_type:complete
MKPSTYVEWDEVRQVLDRLVAVTGALMHLDSINLRVGPLRAQLVPAARSLRLLTRADTAVLRLPIAATLVQSYPHHTHYLLDGYSIIQNRPAQEPMPEVAIHVA